MRHSEVHREASTPQGDDVTKTEEDDGKDVRPFRTLRTVTERDDDDEEESADVDLEHDFENFWTSAVRQEVERVSLGLRGCRFDELDVIQHTRIWNETKGQRTKKNAR